MKALLVTTSEPELSALNTTFSGLKCFEENRYKGRHGNIDLELLNTGAGMVAMVYNLTKLLQKENYDLLINAGICGSFSEQFAPGDVLLVEEDFFADLGASYPGGFLDMFELKLASAEREPFQNGRIRHDPGPFENLFRGINKARGISLNTVTGTAERTKSLKERYNPQVETMEGAGFFYVCRLEKLNFVQLRAVSNFVGPRNKDAWKTENALQALGFKLKEIFNNYE